MASSSAGHRSAVDDTTKLGLRPAVLVVDMQQDYFNDGELRRRRDDLVAACNTVIDAATAAGLPVVEVRTVHRADRSTWALNMHEDGAGLTIEGTRGAERVPGLHEATELVDKTRDSAFHRTDLLPLLRGLGADAVVLCGVSTESCIAATATDAYAHDLPVLHVGDAQASVSPDLHEQTLDRLQAQYRQPTASAAAVAERLAGLGA